MTGRAVKQDWSKKFQDLFPDEWADSAGAWAWQEMNTLYDLKAGLNPDRSRMQMQWWVEQRAKFAQRDDDFGAATVRRCNRMITLLIEHKLRGAP
jgi:hypothetical protein